ncbi:MAG: hypothetical protein Q9225_008114, partial [Loekoesia sp. 1 TL-2023]
MATPTRPQAGRQSSRVPGGFDTDEDLSPIKTEFDHDDFDNLDQDTPSKSPQNAPSQSLLGDNSSVNTVGDDAKLDIADEGNTVDEKEIRRKLMDIDSSFLPSTSPAAQIKTSGADDTYVYGEGKAIPDDRSNQSDIDKSDQEVDMQESPATPPEMYQTPAPGREEIAHRHSIDDINDPSHYNTSSLETMSSSPTAAAAARTVSRAVSSASTGGYETADDTHDSGVPLEYDAKTSSIDQDATPRRATEIPPSSSVDNSPTPRKPNTGQEDEGVENSDHVDAGSRPDEARKRPAYLR